VGHTQPWQRVEGRGPSRLLFALVAASCAMSLLVVTKNSSAAGTSAAAAAGQPRVSPRGIDTLSDVVCPSAISCYAVGEYESTGPGSIIGSSDGGDHWQRLMVTPKRVQPIAIACPTPSTCVVAGEITPPGWPKVDANAPLPSEHAEALLTTDDGAHWSSETLPKVGGVIGVTCASVSVCLVVGYRGGIARTTNGGETWRTETMPPGPPPGPRCTRSVKTPERRGQMRPLSRGHSSSMMSARSFTRILLFRPHWGHCRALTLSTALA
jgi:photosystem II stability/assembly factor-like uncharacterized protein